ncbi:hypothetical protein AVEN_23635-1 [Araneus ventricosus]|uniref:Uncharacterized protein n=1 Tax=Araneus ventricosus TaxID=182803 RepID=A0A4Y2BJP3_ARAVE|nr:hypothetical protein AVEN_23635-1 [Araneus ventricosus]
MRDDRLNQVPSLLPAASEELLQLISCNCKITVIRDWDSRYQRKKADLHFSKFCSSFLGEACKNSTPSISGFGDDVQRLAYIFVARFYVFFQGLKGTYTANVSF